MLCGYLRPTKGYALIRGLDIRSQMDEIHLQMGKFFEDPPSPTNWANKKVSRRCVPSR